MKNWQTTVAGVAGAIAILASQVQAIFDGNPETVYDFSVIVAGLSVLGIGWFSSVDSKSETK